jgi:hypothetical protein
MGARRQSPLVGGWRYLGITDGVGPVHITPCGGALFHAPRRRRFSSGRSRFACCSLSADVELRRRSARLQGGASPRPQRILPSLRGRERMHQSPLSRITTWITKVIRPTAIDAPAVYALRAAWSLHPGVRAVTN